MTNEILKEAWDQLEGPTVFTTVADDGVPNAIYATCVKMLDDGRIVIADNYFDKTRANIQNGSKGTLLFITEAGKAFQLKGSIQYLTEGTVYEDMRKWVDEKHPRIAAAALVVEEAFSGAERII